VYRCTVYRMPAAWIDGRRLEQGPSFTAPDWRQQLVTVLVTGRAQAARAAFSSAATPLGLRDRSDLQRMMASGGGATAVPTADAAARAAAACVRRRLEFSKMLSSRLCAPALDNMLDADVAWAVAARMVLRCEAWGADGLERAGREEVRARDDDLAGMGFGGSRLYLTSPPLEAGLCSLRISCQAMDQGWGNTGHSSVALAVYRRCDPEPGGAPGRLITHERGVLGHYQLVTRLNLGVTHHELATLEVRHEWHEHCTLAAAPGKCDGPAAPLSSGVGQAGLTCTRHVQQRRWGRGRQRWR
jgi:hypothetical protein